MDKSKIEIELAKMYQKVLLHPFPYEDTRRIQKDFKHQFSLLSEPLDFNPDFNTYCTTIAGSISYVIDGKANRLPPQRAKLLLFNFFERFPVYKFLENSVSAYPTFNDEYTSFEKARKLLLEYLN
jgi:hypothetical protein